MMNRQRFMNDENPNTQREEAGSTTTGMSSLPEEILVDIFMKLPVKSISISRCVCKIWCNLLSSHRFIKYHLINNAIQNKKHHKLMLIDNLNWLDRKYFSIYSMEFATATSSPLPSFSGAVKLDCAFENNEHNHVGILGSCNGLVCLGMYSVEKPFALEYKCRVCIWNPLTGKYKEILAPIANMYWRYGFGFDCNNDNYKLVRIGKNEETGSNAMQVYTLGSDSWSKMQAIPYSFRPNHDHRKDGVFLFNGSLHWLGINTTRETSIEVIMSFNINTERIIDVPLPEHTPIHPNHRYKYRSLAVLGDNLCLFDVHADYSGSSVAEIWEMLEYGIRESWSQQCSIAEQTIPQFNGFPCIHPYSRLVCALEGDEFFIVGTKELVIYDQKKKTFRQLDYQIGGMINSGVTYIESLVSPNLGIDVRKKSIE